MAGHCFVTERELTLTVRIHWRTSYVSLANPPGEVAQFGLEPKLATPISTNLNKKTEKYNIVLCDSMVLVVKEYCQAQVQVQVQVLSPKSKSQIQV